MVIIILQVIIGLFFMFTGSKIISGKMADEFKRFGMPPIFNFLTGFIEIASAIGLFAGIWFPIAAVIAGFLLAVTMFVAAFTLLAIAKDPFPKAIPAIVLCLLSIIVSMNHLI
ncbi:MULTISPECIES: DoxX family protein [Paenibacillus]|uniref:DoxX family protein n=1 Tax=Paenibacillus alvei TaxID=44250 RepID=A0AAP6ZZ94_PAEAL|nr:MULTISPECIES: DoxX family protein [Paenibacillus]NEZ44279.1 DoxX family membrane protein [Paenibacillus alvei]NOJ72750.1 DoxX family protein [Paenibacillus alvei]